MSSINEQNQLTNQNSVQLNIQSYNLEKNKYYLINNNTGEETHIQNTGEQIKKFNASLTGQAQYKERIAKAQNKQELPYRAKSLTIVPEKMFYIPKTDKFYNYMQYPNELVQPYYNQKSETNYMIDKNKIKQKLNMIKNNKALMNQFNQRITKDKSQTVLTGTIHDRKLSEKTNQLKILHHRNATETTPLSENQHLNATKIINGIISTKPNESFLRTQLQKIKLAKDLQLSSSQQYEAQLELAKQQFNNKISYERFSQKVQSPSTTTLLFPPQRSLTFQPDILEIATYYKKHQTLHRTPSLLLPLVSQFKTTTFQKSVVLGYNSSNDRPDTVIGLKSFDKSLQQQKMELQNWTSIEEPPEKKFLTKNRFNSTLPNCAAFNLADRNLHKQFFPEPEEKIRKRKRLFIDPITGKTLVNPSKVTSSQPQKQI